MKTISEVHQGYDKAIDIINSCETPDQLYTCVKYVKLFERYYSPASEDWYNVTDWDECNSRTIKIRGMVSALSKLIKNKVGNEE